MKHFNVLVANDSHLHFAEAICNEMELSAKARGTGIAWPHHAGPHTSAHLCEAIGGPE